jgi:hypothetical protein
MVLERKSGLSQKDAAPIPNAVYGKQEVQFLKKNPTFKSQIPIQNAS